MRGGVKGISSPQNLSSMWIEAEVGHSSHTEDINRSKKPTVMYGFTAFLYYLKLERQGRGKHQLPGVHPFAINKISFYNLGYIICFTRLWGVIPYYVIEHAPNFSTVFLVVS
jgi:hypothetical protein